MATTRPRRLWHNKTTYAGAAFSTMVLLFILSLLFFDIIAPHGNPYIGLFTFLVLPGFLVIGLIVTILGVVLALRRVRRGESLEPVQFLPRIDLNIPAQRRIVIAVLSIAAMSVPFIGIMSYEGYHYTESNEFCGTVCHAVMQPQYWAHEASPHARVRCAECHIGEGAGWFVKSKLSGIRQVLAVTLDTYPHPIPTAIEELRPATDTCEQCHWPEHFYGDQLVMREHFGTDEESSARPLRLLMRTGGSDNSIGQSTGIHWHVARGHSVEYVATDEALQEIPWIRFTDHKTGVEKVFRSDGLKSDAPPPSGHQRTMDCMDCHNRATHVFRSPLREANEALADAPGLRRLPFAKRELVRALVENPGADRDGAKVVTAALDSYYRENYPEETREYGIELERLLEVAAEIAGRMRFADMGVDWRTYPNNAGHFMSPGCFRCHAGDHVDEENRPIVATCKTCHTFLNPAGGAIDGALTEGEFTHPVELEGSHAEMQCHLCHEGGLPPAAECANCHVETTAYIAGEGPAFAGYDIEETSMNEAVECVDCHDLTAEDRFASLDVACMDCHDDEPEIYEGMLLSWMQEIDKLLIDAGSGSHPQRQATLEALQKAGPFHNIEATRIILRALAQKGAVADDTAGGENDAGADAGSVAD